MERRCNARGCQVMSRLVLFFGVYFVLLLILQDSHKALEGAAIFSMLELLFTYAR